MTDRQTASMSIIVLVLSLGRQICEYPDTTLFQPDRQRAGGTSGVFTGVDINIDSYVPTLQIEDWRHFWSFYRYK